MVLFIELKLQDIVETEMQSFSLSKKVNPYKACIYGLCRDFLDDSGYDLGTKYLFTFRYSSFIA